MDPKHRVPKLITDEMGVRWMKTLSDLESIDIVPSVDFEVPHAQFIFPVTCKCLSRTSRRLDGGGVISNF